MTGSTGAIERRPGVEAQVAVTPGFFLSSATTEDVSGRPSQQAAGWLDAGEWVGAQGLAVGGRYVGGDDSNGYGEPMVRYRHAVDSEDRFTLQAAGFGTVASGSNSGASYEATRLGAEVAFDGRVTPKSSWLEVHGFGGASVLGLDASGTYCTAPATGIGVDCREDGTDHVVSGDVAGAFPAAFAGIGIDMARHLPIAVHGARLEAMAAGGMMPEIRDGVRTDTKPWTTFGVAITVRAGAAEETK